MAKPYHWFQGESVDELTRQLTAHPGCRLEVHQAGTAMVFVVKPAGEVTPESHELTHINDSHICPPDCG